jgi:hypothetical protein
MREFMIKSAIYQQEILVTERTREHWIPIQKQLFPYINKELVKNDTIELFIILIGKVKSEFIFIATEFEKPISPDYSSIQKTASMRDVHWFSFGKAILPQKAEGKNQVHVANVIRH